MENLQNQLNELYLDYMNKVFADKVIFDQIQNFEISSPIFLNCNAEFGKYIDSDNKVLYVGKETNYWFNQKERENSGLLKDISDYDKYLLALTDLYKSFNIGHNYKRAIFTFMDILVEKLRSNNEKTGILWTNLLRHDYFGNGKVPSDVEQKITYDKNYIFRVELEILKPDAIVFVTGPKYDYILEKTFPGIRKVAIKNMAIGEICLLEHKEIPRKAIRVYHPDAHKYQGGDYRWELSSVILDVIDK
ncbi:MAG: hypothetical protein A2W85_10420 [Bacteroidetes bacterium GWF2_41_31]|nr:MAG: hypothetical protein A2W85_10420 [Bacteroidetes bacterium GWF2_41_31]OFZ04197.1 MAG: hypothetical protein A2338_05645 [Bacteroidetes bacterium RIFOXYB12_FULL_41_6]